MSQLNAPHFQSPEAAREYLETLRWGSERVCPHCGTVNQSFATKKPGVYRCGAKECRKDFSVTTKSVMESSHIKLNVWLQAFYLMASSKKGISSHQLHRTLGITYKSAWFLTHRIREAMRAGGLMSPMGGNGGVVEVDETFYGRLKGQPKKGRRAWSNKNVVRIRTAWRLASTMVVGLTGCQGQPYRQSVCIHKRMNFAGQSTP
jgi:transposase-like protein